MLPHTILSDWFLCRYKKTMGFSLHSEWRPPCWRTKPKVGVLVQFREIISSVGWVKLTHQAKFTIQTGMLTEKQVGLLTQFCTIWQCQSRQFTRVSIMQRSGSMEFHGVDSRNYKRLGIFGGLVTLACSYCFPAITLRVITLCLGIVWLCGIYTYILSLVGRVLC